MKIFCGVQARLDSSRLPRKCFAPLSGKALLGHVLERCLMMKCLSRTALLVPEEDQDVFARFLADEKLPVVLFGGSGEDVLGRYEAAAQCFGWEGAVMRVTGDNPLVSVVLAERLAGEFCGEGIIHYLGNPMGTGVEIFARKDLALCCRQAQDPYEREHCTPYFYRHPELFRVSEPESPLIGNVRATVDTPEDLKRVQGILDAAPLWGIRDFHLPKGFRCL